MRRISSSKPITSLFPWYSGKAAYQQCLANKGRRGRLRGMNFSSAVGLVVGLALASIAGGADGASAPAADVAAALREAEAGRLRAVGALAESTRGWETERRDMEAMLGALRSEIESKRRLLEMAQGRVADEAGKVRALEAEAAGLAALRDAWIAAIAAGERTLAGMLPSLPAGLVAKVAPATVPAAPGTTIAARLARLLDAIALVEAYGAAAHLESVVDAAPDGARRIEERLYLGLGCAWYLPAGGRRAGVLRLVDGRWTKEPLLSEAESAPVFAARDALAGSGPAAFHLLPLPRK